MQISKWVSTSSCSLATKTLRERLCGPSEIFIDIAILSDHIHISLIRLETPRAHPTHPTFLPTFNKVGGDVWQEWDAFLDKAYGVVEYPLHHSAP